MTGARLNIPSIASGIAVIVLGIVPVVAVMTSEVGSKHVGTTTASTTAPSLVQTVLVADPVPLIEMPGVDPAVARTLYANGYAQELSPEDLAGTLPAAVVRVLIANDVVLTIATDGGG